MTHSNEADHHRNDGQDRSLSDKVIGVDMGNRWFAEVLRRLKCKYCRRAPSPVYLCASQHRVFRNGPLPDCSLEIVPAPREV
jgi:hypothetical protein